MAETQIEKLTRGINCTLLDLCAAGVEEIGIVTPPPPQGVCGKFKTRCTERLGCVMSHAGTSTGFYLAANDSSFNLLYG